jgi:hypothetical protein
MKFPLVRKEKWHIPKDGVCPYCKKNKINNTNGFVQISGGADDGKNGFLYLMYHREPVEKHYNSVIDIAKDVKDGQFDIQFCSIKCLRSFLNSLCDEIEIKISNS